MKLLKDSIIYLIGEVFTKLFPFALIPYLTRQLGPEEYGHLSYYLALITLLSIIIGLIQQDVVSRFYFFYGKRSIYNTIVVGTILSISVYGGVVLFGLCFNVHILLLLATVALFQCLLQPGLSLLQCQKKPFHYVTIQFFVTVIGFFATVVLFEFVKRNAEIRVFSIGIGNLVGYLILICLILKKIRKIKIRFFHKYSLHAICYSFPLIIHHLSYYIKGQFDRVFINSHFSTTQLGVYSAGLQLSMVLPVVLMALAKGGVPHYYEMIKSNKLNPVKILKISFLALLICFIPAVIAFLIPNDIYIFVLGEGYSDAKYYCYFFLVCFALNGGYLILANHFFYIGRNKLVVAANILSAIVYIILLYSLSEFGLSYIPFAMLISNITLYVVVLYFYYSVFLKGDKERYL